MISLIQLAQAIILQHFNLIAIPRKKKLHQTITGLRQNNGDLCHFCQVHVDLVLISNVPCDTTELPIFNPCGFAFFISARHIGINAEYRNMVSSTAMTKTTKNHRQTRSGLRLVYTAVQCTQCLLYHPKQSLWLDFVSYAMDGWKKPHVNIQRNPKPAIRYGSMHCTGKSAFVYCSEILCKRRFSCSVPHSTSNKVKQTRQIQHSAKLFKVYICQRYAEAVAYSTENQCRIYRNGMQKFEPNTDTPISLWAQSAIRCKLCGDVERA